MHLAQLDIGLPVAPLTGPEPAGFRENREPVNALAEAAPGFVWRLQTEDGDATALRPFVDDRMIVDASVWTSVEALAADVYSEEHRDIIETPAGVLRPDARGVPFPAPDGSPAPATTDDDWLCPA